jgi:hypothetical protein
MEDVDLGELEHKRADSAVIESDYQTVSSVMQRDW